MVYVMTSDTWLKEFEEAMQMADDIDARIRERDKITAAGGNPTHLISATRRKITNLGTNLDRLETLLQNPPAKPPLNEKELYRRHEMILGIRFKTNQMAGSLSTSHSPRTESCDGDPKTKPAETLGAVVVDIQKQDEQGNENSTRRLETRNLRGAKHFVIDPNTHLDPNIQTHLLSNIERGNINNEESSASSYVKPGIGSCSIQLVCLVILGVLGILLMASTVMRVL